MESVKTTYRNLLRAAKAAAHFSRAGGNNLSRLYRTQLEVALERRAEDRRLDPNVQQTLLFLLSASHSPVINAEEASKWKQDYLAHPGTFARFETGQSKRSFRNAKRNRFKAALKSGMTPSQASAASKPPPSKLLQMIADRPQRPRDGGLTLAHKVTANLSSLTYHHLSPNTRMMRLSRRTGGTDASTMPKLTRSSLQAAGYSDEEIGSGDAGGSREHILSLIVPPKPIRGPRQVSGTPAKRWDGQKASMAVSGTGANAEEIERLEARVEELRQKYESLKSAPPLPASGKKDAGRKREQEIEAAKQTWRQVRGLLKTQVKAAEKHREEKRRELLPLEALHEVIRQAEQETSVWLGSARFGKRVRGEWLPP